MTNMLTSVNEWIKCEHKFIGHKLDEAKNVCLLSELKNNNKKEKESNVTFC